MAGLGPFALLWVGTATFLMSAKSGSALVANTMVWIWGLIYPVMNIALIVAHYHLSPPMYAWLAVAPMNANPIDSAKPWNLPVEKSAEPAAVVVEIAAPVVAVDAEVSVESDADFESSEADATTEGAGRL